MGNSTSTTTTSSRKGDKGSDRGRRSKRSKDATSDNVASRASQVVGDSVRELQAGIQNGIKKLEEQDHPAAQLLDTLCSPYLDSGDRYGSFYSEDISEEDSRTMSEDETTVSNYPRGRSGKNESDARSMETGSLVSQSDDYSTSDLGAAGASRQKPRSSSAKAEKVKVVESSSEIMSAIGNDEVLAAPSTTHKKPLASSFAKRCYFTKSGIGGQTQHYEGLTLTGNVVLMLAAAMKLKGCPTICDEDLRRVEQTYPNQFSRLPDELLLSSGWRRISKYCHFSNKPIPDGMPFFHSKQRLHPSGGYYFLLAAAVGMVRPIDVEPLTRDTLVLLETDYPQTCDTAPTVLIQDPNQWILVDKFCFFSGGPINTDEDVYYQADFDGNPIYMLAFLSPSLTPAELYKLDSEPSDPALKSVDAVREVESVYDLTDRDFDDLKLYHLGPCRALPPYILQPSAWTKVLPQHFLSARQQALIRAQNYEQQYGMQSPTEPYGNPMGKNYEQQQAENDYYDHFAQPTVPNHHFPQQMHHQQQPYQHNYGPPHPSPPPSQYEQQQHQPQHAFQRTSPEQHLAHHHQQQQHAGSGSYSSSHHSSSYNPHYTQQSQNMQPQQSHPIGGNHMGVNVAAASFRRDMEEDGAFVDPTVPIDEAMAKAAEAAALQQNHLQQQQQRALRLDPPEEDEPPSLSKRSSEQSEGEGYYQYDHGHEDDVHDDDIVDEQDHVDVRHEVHRHEVHRDDIDDPGKYYRPDDDVADGDDYYDHHQQHEQQEQYQNHQQNNFIHNPQYDHRENGKYYADSPQESPMSGGENDYVLPCDTEESSQPSPVNHLHLDTRSPELDGAMRPTRRDELPPVSPRTPNSDAVFATTPAMRGAQELLRRNRQRRQESLKTASEERSEAENNNPALTSPRTDSESGATWESGSDFTGSSVWTDASNNPERSSRRALILQMARARMKNNRSQGGSVISANRGTIASGDASVESEDNKQSEQHQNHHLQQVQHQKQIVEEKKVDGHAGSSSVASFQQFSHAGASTSSQQEDFDLTGDLD